MSVKYINATYDYALWTNYAVIDPFNPSQVHLNGTVNGVKKSFSDTSPGCGTAYWGGLSLGGTSIPIQLESTEPLTYNATALARFSRSSTSISYAYSANQTGTYWSSSFSTTSVGSGYNLTVPYHSKWTNVKVFRNGTDVTAQPGVIVSGGIITIPTSIASGNNGWIVTARSPNRVTSVSFDQAIYYRGQTLSVSTTKDMINLQTDLVTYYDQSGTQRGATIGTSFPLGTYTAAYWCENGTDAGFRTTTVVVTDNGSISMHLTDSLGRDVPGSIATLSPSGKTATTDLLGRATVTDVTYGSYTIAFSDPIRGTLGSTPVVVGASSVQANYQMATPYTFAQVPVTMTFTDRFGDPFPAIVSIANSTRVITTTSTGGTATSGGFFSTNLDEGTYSISVQYPSGKIITMNSSSFTVQKNVMVAFSFRATSLDANPLARTGTIVAVINDSLGRYLDGLSVSFDGVVSDASGITSPSGQFSAPIYWGNGTSVNITWSDASGTVATLSTTISTSGTKVVVKELATQYIFKDIPVTISVQDKFGDGYPARIVASNGTVVLNATANSGGTIQADLDEGTYTFMVYYPGNVLVGTYPGSVVLKSTGTTFYLPTTIDAHPAMHVATITSHLEDSDGRDVYGVQCNATNGQSTSNTTTDSIGNATVQVYWGNFTSYTVSWNDGSPISSAPITISESKAYHLDHILGFRYNFTALRVEFNVTDKDDFAYPAFLKVFKNSVLVVSGGANAYGYFTTMLSEGIHDVHVEYPAGTVNKIHRITVDLSNYTSMYLIKTSISSQVKICALTVNVKDSLDRDIPATNVTVTGEGISWAMRSEATDGGGNVLFPSLPYQDYPTYNVTVYFGTTKVGSFIMTVVSDVQHSDFKATVQFTFHDIVTTFTVVDAFSVGYRANIEILDNTTTLLSETTTGSGQQVFDLDEGTYVSRIYHGTTLVNSSSFTVRKNTGTAFTFSTPIDAYPDTHSSALRVNTKDSLGRVIGGLSVNVTSNFTSYQSITDGEGKVIFSSVYWGFDQWFDLTIMDGSFILHSNTTRVDAPRTITWTKAGQYVFRHLGVTLTIVDVNGHGFKAGVKVYKGTLLDHLVEEGYSNVNGIFSLVLDEGNYTARIYHENGTLVSTENFTVFKETGTSFSMAVPIDAYPPFVMPIWFWILIAVGALVVSLVSILAYRSRHEKMEREWEEITQKSQYFRDIEGTRMVMCMNPDGLELATVALTADLKEKADLASGLVTALSSFGKEMDSKVSRMKSFHYDEFSGYLFKGNYITVAVIVSGDVGKLYEEKVNSFIEQYERDHDEDMKGFKGNVIPFEKDFKRYFGRIVGTDMMEPSTWRMDKIGKMYLNPVLKAHLNFLINKSGLKYPSLKEFLVTLRSKERAPPEAIFEGLYEIYMGGFIYPASLDTKKNLQRYTLGSIKSATTEELKSFQDMIRVEEFELGKILDNIDKQIQEVTDKVESIDDKKFSPEQKKELEGKYGEVLKTLKERAKAVSGEMRSIEEYSFESWKMNGCKIVLEVQEAGLKEQ